MFYWLAEFSSTFSALNIFRYLTVRTAGSTITWTNRDSFGHDVSFEGGSRSPVLEQGDTYQQAFPTPGTFDYVCTLHSGMVGRVTVTAA